uniref:Uncharacterized protein n=1 Tax=Arundo donax TaxID=35708 RepID=A0A0A9BC39_ARUDO
MSWDSWVNPFLDDPAGSLDAQGSHQLGFEGQVHAGSGPRTLDFSGREMEDTFEGE